MFYRFRCLILLLGVVLPTWVAAGELAVMDARIGDAPPTAIVRAAYFSVVNPGQSTVTIRAVSSTRADRTEMHRTAMEGGMAMMRMHKQISIAPGETVRFEPGGLHVMLIGARGLQSGERVPMKLELQDGREIRFSARVLGRE